MQDLMGKLQEILSTKEGQAQLNNIASMLNNQSSNQSVNQNTATPNPPSQGFDISSLASMLSGNNNANAENASADNNTNTMPDIDMGMIMNIQKLLSNGIANDKNAQLLMALKPHFSEKRQAKVDQAMTIMRLISMLPLLKESGVLKGLL